MQSECQVCWGNQNSGDLFTSQHTLINVAGPGFGDPAVSVVFTGRQVVIPIDTSKTYFYVDIVFAVLYHIDVSSMDGLFMVLYTSRPVSSRTEQL